MNSNPAYFLGIDGGGSRCRARIRDRFGALLAESIGGSSNIYQDFEGALRNITATAADAAQQAGIVTQDLHAGFGLAGLVTSKSAEPIMAAHLPFASVTADNDAYPPLRLALPVVPESVPRSAALNLFKAIPHYVVLMVFLFGAAVVAVIGWFAVLFTGAWPPGMRSFLVRVSNYYYRVWTYITMVENDYPPFGLPSR